MGNPGQLMSGIKVAAKGQALRSSKSDEAERSLNDGQSTE